MRLSPVLIGLGCLFATLQSIGALGGFSVTTTLGAGGLLGGAGVLSDLLAKPENAPLVRSADLLRHSLVDFEQSSRGDYSLDEERFVSILRAVDAVDASLDERDDCDAESTQDLILKLLYMFVITSVSVKPRSKL